MGLAQVEAVDNAKTHVNVNVCVNVFVHVCDGQRVFCRV